MCGRCWVYIPASQQQLQIKQQYIKGWSAVPSSLIFTFPAQRQHSQQDQQWQQQQAIPASNERGTNNNASNVGMPSPVLSFHLRWYSLFLNRGSNHNNTSNQKHTAHANSHHKNCARGGTSLSPCSLPSYTCFVPIRTCAQGGYFTLPLLITIVYVFRTSSYLCAGRVLHSPPACTVPTSYEQRTTN